MRRFLFLPLLALTLASALAATIPAASTSDSISYMPDLLNQQAVCNDLKLTPIQKARIDAIRAEYRAKVGVVSAAGLLDTTLDSKAEKKLASYHASCNQRVLRILTPAQRIRFREIERQFQGGLFLLSPSEQNLLKLTPDQRHKAAEILSVDSAKASEVQKAFLAGKKSALRKEIDLHRIQRTTARSLLHLLTPEQKTEWLASLGTPVKK
jgi:Spy/CpxP family protein refolding chaperone